jgi:tetratricopeptide (TPR) repeat protein
MKKRILFVSLFTFSLLMACNQSLLDKLNPNLATADSYYKTADELVKGVNSVYAIMQSRLLWGREYFFTHDLRGDDMAAGGGQLEVPRRQLLEGTHTPSNAVMSDVWTGFYRMIHRANAVITNAPLSTDLNTDLINRATGEAKFLRAMAYFELSTLWGKVPLYKTYATTASATEPRAELTDVFDLIISDLNDAQTKLPAEYTGNNIGRATKGAAQTLLARVYMFQGNYTAAKAELDKVISSNKYQLVDNFLDNSTEETEYNKESIFEVAFSLDGGGFSWGSVDADDPDGAINEQSVRSQEYSAVGWRNLLPSNKLLADFESVANGDAKDDPRFAFSFYRSGDDIAGGVLTDAMQGGNSSVLNGNTVKISWRKYSATYKNSSSFYTSGINFRVMRYAEVLLMAAECENELGNSAKAIEYLNQVRSRPSVNMPAYPTAKYPVNNKAEIFRAMMHEKYVELCGEQIRNRDILRWRKQNKLTSEPISYFQANKYELLPIPQDEINNNPKIGQANQNPGY